MNETFSVIFKHRENCSRSRVSVLWWCPVWSEMTKNLSLLEEWCSSQMHLVHKIAWQNLNYTCCSLPWIAHSLLNHSYHDILLLLLCLFEFFPTEQTWRSFLRAFLVGQLQMDPYSITLTRLKGSMEILHPRTPMVVQILAPEISKFLILESILYLTYFFVFEDKIHIFIVSGYILW